MKTIIDACNAGGMSSAPMLRVHTGNLADLMGIVQGVDSQIFKARHCGNVDWDVYNVNRVKDKVEDYMQGLVALAGTNNHRHWRPRLRGSLL